MEVVVAAAVVAEATPAAEKHGGRREKKKNTFQKCMILIQPALDTAAYAVSKPITIIETAHGKQSISFGKQELLSTTYVSVVARKIYINGISE